MPATSDWKVSLTDERAQLSDRLTKLVAYLDNTDTILNTSDKPLSLLVIQRALMKAYLDVLDQRLALIPPGV